MHIRILVVILFIAKNINCNAQDTTATASNAVYLEFGGNAGYGSVNYERIALTTKKIQLSVRAGLSTLKIKDYRDKFNPDIVIPLAFNVMYGKDHKLETGLGTTFINTVSVGENLSPKRTSALHGNLHIGYRYQKATGGLLFRFCYTPLFDFSSSFRHWAGVSVGYAF